MMRKNSLKRIIGILLTITSLAVLLSGAYIVYLNSTKTDSEGYALSNIVSIKTSAYAFALWLDQEPNEPGQLKIIVKSTNATKELFIGYAEETGANSYVKNIEYANPLFTGQQIYGWDIYYAKLGWTSSTVAGKPDVAPSRPPTMETFWLQKLQTQSTTTLYWEPVRNLNAPKTLIVIMNSDGSRDIQADIILGYKSSTLPWIPYLLMPLGLVIGVTGFILSKRK
jgi:hypothetical protein